MNENINTFEILNKINVSEKIKQKMNLSYLSWADAWGELKKAFPDSFYTIYKRTVETKTTETIEDKDFNSTRVIETITRNDVPYFTDGKTCYVQVGVTINNVEYVEYLPVMDNKNNAVLLSSITMTQVNKAIQRAFVKACARHGLGLYVYAGEDLPESEKKPVITIDYNAIEDKINKIEFKTLSQEEKGEIAKEVGEMYSKLVETSAGTYINEYMQRLIKDYNINKISENDEALQRLYSMLKEIEQLIK